MGDRQEKLIISRLDECSLLLLLYRNIFTHVVYLDQLLGACQVCISTGSWVPLIVHWYLITIFRIYNNDYNVVEFLHLNFNQVLTGRQTKFKTTRSNKLRVGLNAISNRFHCLNDLIPLSWLNMSMNTFKVNCKKLLLNNWNHPYIHSDYVPIGKVKHFCFCDDLLF